MQSPANLPFISSTRFEAQLRGTRAAGNLHDALTPEDIFLKCAQDSELFGHLFFPKTFRQPSPQFHKEISHLLESPSIHFAGIECFRGSAKTTKARTTLAKRISYATSRTILIVSETQAHAIKSVRWVKKQIETNKNWTDFYSLKAGDKWTDEWIEVVNGIAGEPVRINLVAIGITGQTRGLNLDDYRPDFILVDDPNDEENTKTEDQRQKTADALFGSLQPSLAPRSEAPNAKMAVLQTGLHKEDLIHLCHKDPTWRTIKRPIFTYGENGKPNGSAWPERWSFEELLEMKKGYVAKRKLHIWLREYECRITSPETAIFNIQLLRYYEHYPERLFVYAGIDPASSDAAKAHEAAIVFWGFGGGGAYLLDYWKSRGKNPEEIWTAFYARAIRWRPLVVGVESISYQKMLAWYFRKRMMETNYWVTVREIQDRRAKEDRITQAHSGLLHNGWMYLREDQTEYITALEEYDGATDNDLLDAGSMGLMLRNPAFAGDFAGEDDDVIDAEKDVPALPMIGGCP